MKGGEDERKERRREGRKRNLKERNVQDQIPTANDGRIIHPNAYMAMAVQSHLVTNQTKVKSWVSHNHPVGLFAQRLSKNGQKSQMSNLLTTPYIL